MDRDLSTTELWRRLANTVRTGTVAEADYLNARVRVQIEDLTTAWLPWVAQRAGEDATWWPPEVGEQVVVLSPSGELEQGIVVGSLYYQSYPAPADAATIRRIQMGDGAVFEYDREAKKLTVSLPGDADVTVKGKASFKVTGNVSVATDGKADVSAKKDVVVSSGGTAKVDAKAVEIAGTDGQVVTTKHVCAYTGNPHPQGSTLVKAGG